MNDDLSKADQEWAHRSLFRPTRRRRGRWLWLVAVVAAAAVLLVWQHGGFITPSL